MHISTTFDSSPQTSNPGPYDLPSPGTAAGTRASQPLPPGQAMAASAVADAASASSAADTGVITSSDFLTLLVTELKNQDPTTTQDPNAYITQLVQVNSLQQLIAINQDLTPTT